MTASNFPPIKLTSFGYLHDVPTAEVTIDVRQSLRDPAVSRDLLALTGRDDQVREVVMRTPGVTELLSALITQVTALRALPVDRPRRLAIGSVGGRHRSVVLVDALATMLHTRGIDGTVTHLHMHMPRVMNLATQLRTETR